MACYQYVAVLACTVILGYLTLRYHPNETPCDAKAFEKAALMGKGFAVFAFLSVGDFVLLYFGIMKLNYIQIRSYFRVCGWFSAITAALAMLPQLWITYKEKSAKSVSIVSVLGQCIGGIVLLAVALSMGKDQSQIIPNSTTLLLKIVLAGMIIYYDYLYACLRAKKPRQSQKCKDSQI